MSGIRGMLSRASSEDDDAAIITMPAPPIEKLMHDLDLIRSDQASAMRRMEQLRAEERRILAQILAVMVSHGVIDQDIMDAILNKGASNV